METPTSLEEIYHRARSLHGEEREFFLGQACGSNAELRAEVDGLLQADADAGAFLASAAGGAGDVVSEAPGTAIGPYKIVERIGEGGFGVVFKARQDQPVQRAVALKIIKRGMDTRQVVERFEQERQTLAVMDHPGIAKVFDAGATEGGRPYFVMELVQGAGIIEFCDEYRLTIRERLEVFAQVCHAVQHAHSKGVIHRDLKPSNVLVSMQEGRPVSKVIDFGVAKATDTRQVARAAFTQDGQLVGTPEYMSPEQADGTPDLDTRTDVYSLGVLLYELLTGSTPFDPKTLRSSGYGEILRIIRDVEPSAPSKHLTPDNAALGNVAARRRTEPRRLGTTVRGELDWIVLKALDKDRERRYATANELALEVERSLAGEAIHAAPPSRGYRLRKLIRRNRSVTTAMALVLITLCAGLFSTVQQASVARQQRDRAVLAVESEAEQRATAEVERDRAHSIANFITELLRGVQPQFAQGRDPTMLKALLDDATAQIQRGDLATSPAVELDLRDTIGGVYRSLALYSEAEEMLDPTVDIARAIHGDDHAAVYGCMDRLSRLARYTADLETSERWARESLQMRRRLHSEDSEPVADGLLQLASVLAMRGQKAQATELRQSAADALGRVIERAWAEGEDEERIAQLLSTRAHQLRAAGSYEMAEELFREVLDIYRRIHPGGHLDQARCLGHLAYLVSRWQDFDQAAELLRESLELSRLLLPGDHPETAGRLAQYVEVLARMRDYTAAESVARESLAMCRRLHRGDHPDVAQAVFQLGAVSRGLGQLEDAETHWRESLAMSRRLASGDSILVATRIISVANLLTGRGELEEAEELLREALGMRRRLYPGNHPRIAQVTKALEKVITQQGG